jgi:hypothetical protein
MFDNLIAFTPDPAGVGDFVPFSKATPGEVLTAQVETANWLTKLGVPSDAAIDAKQQQVAARDAFTSLHFDTDNAKQRLALTTVRTPAAVQHLTGMLTAYDWNFIEHAKELRGYTVAKILEETKHPDARIRLKALQMLGGVTAGWEREVMASGLQRPTLEALLVFDQGPAQAVAVGAANHRGHVVFEILGGRG